MASFWLVKPCSFVYNPLIMTVEEIEKMVASLPKPDFQRFVAWLDEYRWQAWDQQIADDSKAGRLDALLQSVEAEIAAGKTASL